MMKENRVVLHVKSIGENVALVRMVASGFLIPYDLTMEELDEIKIALSEAVTNCIIHGYEEKEGLIYLRCRLNGDLLEVEIEDKGKGIDNIDQAMEPMFTTKPDRDRSGMGFSFMEAFMDELEVTSIPGAGTIVTMKKKLGTDSWLED